MKNKNNHVKAYVIAVDMGYGHQRAAFPLHEIAYKGEIIIANTYQGIPSADKKIWRKSRRAYEFISRFKKIPLIGEAAFNLYDKFQAIPEFYPYRDLSGSSIQLRGIYSLIKSQNWGKHLIDKLAKKPLPIITTFFITAFMAEVFDYPGEIYCLGTDTDLSRAWAPLNPKESRINYLAPSHRAAKRLAMYGIAKNKIFTTGFPLPSELVGEKKEILKKTLAHRIFNLDPNKVYINRYQETLAHHLGKKNLLAKSNHPLTLTFAVGGAGAQRELGAEILNALKEKISLHQLRLILVSGTHHQVNKYYHQKVRQLGMEKYLGKYIKIEFSADKQEYFENFNKILKQTDILWTKPSELTFYTALGLPIIMSDPVGSQEKFNRRWLKTIGSGIDQENVRYTKQWLFDWLNSGWFAEAALEGYLEASTSGLDNIHKIIGHKPEKTIKIKQFSQY